MKKITFLFLSLFISLSTVMAQNDDDKDDKGKDDSRYLVGAVPLEDGKVVFTQTFAVAGVSQQDIYRRMMDFLTTRMAKNKNASRVVYKDEAKGLIAASGEEYIVFQSTALSLDRAMTNYQITVAASAGQCVMNIEKLRYNYQKEKVNAEEWISDDIALNKDKTKLVRGLAKFRRKTVDFADKWFEQAAAALSATPKVKAAEAAPAVSATRAKVIEIVPAQTVETSGVSPITGKPIQKPQTDKTMEIRSSFDHFNINVTDLDRSIAFYNKALGLKEARRKEAQDGSYVLVYLTDNKSGFSLELTWLRDHKAPYELGENESHLCFRVENDYAATRAFHKEMECVCFENEAMGLYFINDPDGYWIEVLPMKK